ncbi:MAG: DUF503 domain-containing protein [Firmicutes bacterium]|jgi:uncharacterized protein YlxP (DUF503 family)|nr:DUF503 domain-containing protein [Bacillota bacterium]
MIVSTISITIRIFDSYSLKDKRSVIKSIIQKSKQKFNISISEVDFQDIHNLAKLGVAVVSNDFSHNQKVIDSLIHFIEENYAVEISDIEDY